MSDESETRRPSFNAYHVKEVGEDQSYFNRIGAAFAHRDGQGHTIQLDSVPVDGRVVLRTPQERIGEAKQADNKRAPQEKRQRRDEYER